MLVDKRSIGFAAILIAIVSVEFSFIYVPEKFEGPLLFRVQSTVLKLLALGAKISSFIRLGVEPIILRNYFNFMVNFVRDSISSQNIKIEDGFINQVPIRSYIPKSNGTLMPGLIFYHGGAFILGSIHSYDRFAFELANRLNYVVISVDYRLAPENPYPTPISDCLKVTNYIIENGTEFQIDANRLVLAGDSAGGNIVAVITQHLAKQNLNIPKVQVLIYPWLQLFNFKLPSYNEYMPKGMLSYLTFSVGKLVYWYLGETNITREMDELIRTNNHIFSINETLREKYISYLDLNLIPEVYKKGKAYYEIYNESKIDLIPDKPSELAEVMLEKNETFKKQLSKLFNKDISPGLADDNDLKNLPKSYFIVLEWDTLKDEALIYSQRLKLNGVSVKVDYYENAYHGILPYIDTNSGYQISRKMFDKLTDYLKANI